MLELCALLLTFSPVPADETYIDELRGFRIEVPEGWRSEPDNGGEGGGHRLTLRPEDVARGVAVRLEVSSLAEVRSAREVCAADLERNEADESFRDLLELATELAGRSAPGFDVIYRAGEIEYRIRRSYLVRDGSAWVLQCNAPVGEFEARWPDFERILDSFEFIELSDQGRFQLRLSELASRCGSEIEWASDWREAAARARAQSRPVLVVVWLLATFTGASNARHGVLMDADVLELINARFVPLWYV